MKIVRYKKKNRFITTYIIAGGFLLVIVLGTLILHLPIASATGQSVAFSDALFTATTSVCVTGLVTLPTYSTWSVFGQVVILLLIQMGGLGVITFTTVFLQVMKRRIGMRERQLIRDAYNLETDNGMGIMVKKVILGTFLVEGIGAILYSFVFVPEFGAAGIWKSIFNAISAFCNAGMDLLGPSSLIPYQTNLLVNLVTMALVILGGIGFPIWFMSIDAIKRAVREKLSPRQVIQGMPLYAKAVFFMTFVLLFGGGVIIFCMEYHNENTIGTLSLGNKILASLFQSMTTRTAGFCSIPQEGLRRCTVIVCCALMFIGGSPSGTAGGIKTTTILILVASLVSALSERNNTEIFHRKIHADRVRKAMSVFSLSFVVMLISLTAFCMVQEGAFEDCLYEVASAIATVGLSRDLTSKLTLGGKLVIVATMYMGRIGPISLSLFFNTTKYVNSIQYPEESMPVG